MTKCFDEFLTQIAAGDVSIVRAKLGNKKFKQRFGVAIFKALLAAAENGHLEILNLLFQFKSAFKVIAEIDNLILKSAVVAGHAAIVNRLLKIADVRACLLKDTDFDTLLLAVECKKHDVIYQLLEFYHLHKITIQEGIQIPGFNSIKEFINEYNTQLNPMFNHLPISGLWRIISEYDPISPIVNNTSLFSPA